MIAANKMYESFKNGGGHPDDWELYKKGAAPKNDRPLHEARANMAEAQREHC